MNETTEAIPIFAPIWRRKWLILLVGVIVAAATYLYYKHQPTRYTASTQIYLGGGSEEQGLLNSTQSKITLNDRDVTDQATLINSNSLGEPVHQRLRTEHHLAAARRKGPRERRGQQRLHHDHRRSAHLQGRRAARRRLRRRIRQAPAHPLPARGERGDRGHSPPAGPHRSRSGCRRPSQSEGD